MTHPLERIEQAALRRLFLAAALGSALLFAHLIVSGRPLRHPGAPLGMLSYEFVWGPAGLDRVLDGWGPAERALAVENIAVDFVFLLVYGAAVSAGALLRRGPLSRSFAWAATAAAALDAVENALGLALLAGAGSGAAAGLMSAAASVKFALIIAAILYAAPAVRAARDA